MEMPGLTYSASDYRYGFNGKEKDPAFGLLHYDYGFRIYHPGLGRFLSVDPLTRSYPWYTPYQFAGNTPIVAVDLDGQEDLIIHSAFWTKQFLELDLFNISEDEILAEVNRINQKGYANKSSLEHARRYYESSGDVVTIVSTDSPLRLTGFTNAELGDVYKVTIYSVADGLGAIDISLPLQTPERGMQNRLSGVQEVAATFVMKYSGFGKLGRALINHMEGEDPWTGEEGSTSELVVGGVTDLATMGYGGVASASTNLVLNAAQEALESLNPSQLEEIGLGRETIDIGLSLTEPNKLIKTVEVISNLIQAGYLTDDLIEKHRQNSENNSNQD